MGVKHTLFHRFSVVFYTSEFLIFAYVAKNQSKHIGENVRFIRRLLGIKQDALAEKLGVAQQNVSKMEKKNNLTENKINRTAEALDVTAEFIKKFDKKAFINNVVAFIDRDQVNHHDSVQEIITYFKEEISKKDTEITELQAKLRAYEGGEKPKKQSGSNNPSQLSAVR